MRKKVIATLAALGPIVALSTVGTFALFTDSEAAAGNLFQSGKIDLALGSSSGLVSFPTGMLPGDISGPNALTVSNAAGSSSLRYSLRVATSTTDTPTKDLDKALQLVVKTKDASGPGCSSFDGTQLFSGDLAATATSGAVFGSPSAGADGGDRALGVNASEVLCFRVTLPTSATNSVASGNATAVFTFDAEQTANN